MVSVYECINEFLLCDLPVSEGVPLKCQASRLPSVRQQDRTVRLHQWCSPHLDTLAPVLDQPESYVSCLRCGMVWPKVSFFFSISVPLICLPSNPLFIVPTSRPPMCFSHGHYCGRTKRHSHSDCCSIHGCNRYTPQPAEARGCWSSTLGHHQIQMWQGTATQYVGFFLFPLAAVAAVVQNNIFHVSTC